MGPGEYLEIYDSHAHYDDKAFDSDRAWLLEKQLPLSGVRCVINMGTRLLTCASTVGLSDLNPYIFAAVGIHPEEIDDTLPENWLECLRVWLENGDAVAVGEIGLDYHWPDSAPRERQREVFAAQLALAKELNYPVCVHDRDAHQDVLALLREYGRKNCWMRDVLSSISCWIPRKIGRYGIWSSFRWRSTAHPWRSSSECPE